MEFEKMNLVQQEIAKALEQLKERSLFTEANLAKKIRENTKLESKKKAGIGINDLEIVVDYLAESKQIYYSLHVNSANDLLIKKEESSVQMDSDTRRRRLSSEKSISILTSSDFSGNKNGNSKKNKANRSERKHINVNTNFEDMDY